MKRLAKAPQERKVRKLRSFLARLARDARGNTLAIVGAALLPLTAMIGSGVDMSRAYMAKTRMQAACDAGALAGRRVMIGDNLSDEVITEARRFFNFNFPQGQYQTATFTPQVTKPSTGVVEVKASTRIPTVVMKVFGFETLPLNVECDASLNFVNTDVVLVLDVTGSMAWAVDGDTTYVAEADKRITALKAAVMALYDALAPIQAQLQANGLRLRYGIVPYSSTVNVGGIIRDADPNYLADTATYQSRVFNYTQEEYTGPGITSALVVEYYPNDTSPSNISKNNCDKYGQNVAFSGFAATTASGTGPAANERWFKTFYNDESAGEDWGYPGSTGNSGNSKKCRRYYTTTVVTVTGRYLYKDTLYKPEVVDVSRFKLGEEVKIATGTNGTVGESREYDSVDLAAQATGVSTTTSKWNGCIMERETVSTITSASNYKVIPSGAHDLDINLIPNSEETAWKPMWPAITYRRNPGVTSAGSGALMTSVPCPAAARTLDVWARNDMQTYVNALTPDGGTYHDIGMIWGARLISTAGIFADACETFNSMPCTRHIIFMTDGELAPTRNSYGAYGIEQNDRKISGSYHTLDDALKPYHMMRFRMACQAAKTLGTSIWVISFGASVSLEPEMTECASNANQASHAGSSAALIAKFTEIGNNIGALRLTQ